MTASQLRVLVVEDCLDDYESLVEFSAGSAPPGALGFERAEDGESAARALGAPDSRFAYVVLDLNLPGMKGIDLLRWIRERPLLRAVPIVVLSTTISERERLDCLEAGANAFHVKPTDYAKFRETVVDLLGYWSRQASLPSSRTVPGRDR